MQLITSLKDFQTLTKLGQGAFGQVFKVKRKLDSQIYAMKKIKLSSMKQKQRENALNQIRILASYNGQNIIGYKQAFYDEVSATLCIIMQLAEGGDILKLVQNHIKNRTKFEESQIWKALVHITQGLRSLHDKKVLHRDLKCANIFVTGNSVYKLGDLNVSKVLKKDMAQTQTGTPYYASPQVWKDQPYGAKSDIWSLGCVLYQMAAFKPPFTATDLSGLYKKIVAGQFQRIPASYSNDLFKVISSLLRLNPAQRPNTIQLLENPLVHRYYKGLIDINEKQKQQQDFLLKTLKLQNGNLKLIKNILPKANYQGQLKSSRSRANSIERIKTQQNKNSSKQLPSIQQSNVIQNYLDIKKRHQENQRQRLINQNDDIIRKRQRVLSACGMRNINSNYQQTQHKKIIDQIKPSNNVLMTPQIQRKDVNCILPPTSNKNLPPKPIQMNPINQNPIYKLPPRPNNLIPSAKQIDYSRLDNSRDRISSRDVPTTSRDRSKQNLMKAGQNILNQDSGIKSSKIAQNISYQQQNKIVRSNSVQKAIYPCWW